MVKDVRFTSEHLELFPNSLLKILTDIVDIGFLRTNQTSDGDTFVAFCPCLKFKLTQSSDKHQKYNFKQHLKKHSNKTTSSKVNISNPTKRARENTVNSDGEQSGALELETLIGNFETVSLQKQELEMQIQKLKSQLTDKNLKVKPLKTEIRKLTKTIELNNRTINNFSKKNSSHYEDSLDLSTRETEPLPERSEITLRQLRNRLEGKNMSWIVDAADFNYLHIPGDGKTFKPSMKEFVRAQYLSTNYNAVATIRSAAMIGVRRTATKEILRKGQQHVPIFGINSLTITKSEIVARLLVCKKSAEKNNENVLQIFIQIAVDCLMPENTV